MAVKKIFWTDSYLTELAAKVTGVEGDVITLDQTIFYANSGGQESDEGTIAGLPVLKAEKRDKEIHYALEGPHDLALGQDVEIRIDWDRRYALMRHHFAAEIILELVYRNYGPVNKIGAHISRDKARLDFEWQGNISDVFSALLVSANEIIAMDRPIASAFCDEIAERRYWEIAGFARVPCGGTHLRTTGEVGEIRLKRNNIGKGKERIEVSLGNVGEVPERNIRNDQEK